LFPDAVHYSPALNLIFSFTNGDEWDGPYRLQFQVPKGFKNKPIEFFNEVKRHSVKVKVLNLFSLASNCLWYTQCQIAKFLFRRGMNNIESIGEQV
jgi:hypothetical protein